MATTGFSIDNDLLYHDPSTWSTLPSYPIPPSNDQFNFHAPNSTHTDRAVLSWDASAWARPLLPLDASPDFGPQSFLDGVTFDIPSGLTPRETLNASNSTTPSITSSSASSSPSELSKGSSGRVSKTRLNTLAARRYRQRRADRTQELEAELHAIKKERDALKFRVSKLEGETNALKALLELQISK
ncbi:hypothetical protein E8E15_004011 [Penicillium rubens]|uniref:BZIP domain-containing protein n=1 Tax=Penicillium chrysogenum TaxID=5076 RepID=A0A167RQP9_PENCH|nr:uncharacterized protein N7525_009877 [Penicillium rubens]KAF3015454.1 hypothetical protein E8E15_004011 [Penicillium rubens]KAJ5831624.1 hypothetical protein N7525_009877 [Penicillium rubens]KAJ5855174.1 hypothetical protein N7534_007717 [Penicillium rubens]KZN86315.1 hypothetical protein EN45_048370 [Penicillium chrysogenum]